MSGSVEEIETAKLEDEPNLRRFISMRMILCSAAYRLKVVSRNRPKPTYEAQAQTFALTMNQKQEREREREMGGGGNQILRRVPRIQFPSRKFKSTATGSASQTEPLTKNDETHHIFTPSSEVPAAVKNTAVGGKASLQPKRTPVSDKEIESIMLGGIF